MQTGSFANYVGAHYWNIQVCCLVRHDHVLKLECISSTGRADELHLQVIALCIPSQDEALGLAETNEGRAYGTYIDADVLFRLTPGPHQVPSYHAH